MALPSQTIIGEAEPVLAVTSSSSPSPPLAAPPSSSVGEPQSPAATDPSALVAQFNRGLLLRHRNSPLRTTATAAAAESLLHTHISEADSSLNSHHSAAAPADPDSPPSPSGPADHHNPSSSTSASASASTATSVTRHQPRPPAQPATSTPGFYPRHRRISLDDSSQARADFQKSLVQLPRALHRRGSLQSPQYLSQLHEQVRSSDLVPPSQAGSQSQNQTAGTMDTALPRLSLDTQAIIAAAAAAAATPSLNVEGDDSPKNAHAFSYDRGPRYEGRRHSIAPGPSVQQTPGSGFSPRPPKSVLERRRGSVPDAIPFLVNVQSPTAARYQGPRSSDVVARRTPRRSSAANHFSFEEAVTGPARDFLSPRDGLSPAVQSPRLSPNIPFSAMPRSGRRPSSDLSMLELAQVVEQSAAEVARRPSDALVAKARRTSLPALRDAVLYVDTGDSLGSGGDVNLTDERVSAYQPLPGLPSANRKKSMSPVPLSMRQPGRPLGPITPGGGRSSPLTHAMMSPSGPMSPADPVSSFGQDVPPRSSQVPDQESGFVAIREVRPNSAVMREPRSASGVLSPRRFTSQLSHAEKPEEDSDGEQEEVADGESSRTVDV